MKTLANIHPGEVLLEEFLLPLGISQNALARAANVPPRRINEIVLGKRSVTADSAVRLAAALGPANGSGLACRQTTILKKRTARWVMPQRKSSASPRRVRPRRTIIETPDESMLAAHHWCVKTNPTRFGFLVTRSGDEDMGCFDG